MSEATPTVTELRDAHVTIFTVRQGWEWGTIIVRPYPTVEGAEVLCNSSFGCYAYGWSAMGEDWRSFLSDLDFHYAMNKLAGRRFEVPFDADEFIGAMRAELDGMERQDTDEDGNVPARVAANIATCREALDELSLEDVHPESYFREFNEAAMGWPYNMELYEARMRKPCPQVRGFWDAIWKPFMEHLRQTATVPA